MVTTGLLGSIMLYSTCILANRKCIDEEILKADSMHSFEQHPPKIYYRIEPVKAVVSSGYLLI